MNVAFQSTVVCATYAFSQPFATQAKRNIDGQLIVASPSNGCSALSNTAAVNGKVVVMDRTVCSNGGVATKVRNAQAAGALAVIIVNDCNSVATCTAAGYTVPAGSTDAISAYYQIDGAAFSDVSIPVFGVTSVDGAALKSATGFVASIAMGGLPCTPPPIHNLWSFEPASTLPAECQYPYKLPCTPLSTARILHTLPSVPPAALR